MTTQTMTLKPTLMISLFPRELARKCIRFIRNHTPRRCMILTAGMLLVGLSIPYLIGFQFIPASLPLAFSGMGITSIGAILYLYYI